jgi:hypothetical protein
MNRLLKIQHTLDNAEAWLHGALRVGLILGAVAFTIVFFGAVIVQAVS